MNKTRQVLRCYASGKGTKTISSQLTYVEAVMSQHKEDLIHACENSLLFYGGTPLAIVPDNLKAAVKEKQPV